MTYICGTHIRKMPETKENSLLLKATAWLLGLVGTLLTIISCLIMGKIDNLQVTLEKLSPVVTINTTNISTLTSNVTSLQSDMRNMIELKEQVKALYALKPDEIRIKREYWKGKSND